MSGAGDRPAWLGGAVLLGPTPQAFAQRVLDGLRRRLGREPTGEDIRAAMAHLDATRSELATSAATAAGGSR